MKILWMMKKGRGENCETVLKRGEPEKLRK
jgi:hypothetical protein